MEDALEKIQQRAARWIDPEVQWLPGKKKWSTSYAVSLMNLKWLSLSRSRLFTTNYLTFKILNNCYPILSEKLQISHQHKTRLISKKSRINVFRFSYFINAPFLWNNLPNCIIKSPSISSFKHALFIHLFNNNNLITVYVCVLCVYSLSHCNSILCIAIINGSLLNIYLYTHY